MKSKLDLKSFFKKFNIMKNLGLKIFAVIISTILWIVVVNITDPVGTQTYKNVPVKIVNAETITDYGKTLEVLDETDVIPVVTLRAPRTVIRELGNSTDNIIAVVDMKDLASDGVTVPIELTTAKYSDKVESIRGTFEEMKVSIENEKTIQIPIAATTSGEIEGGYLLGEVSTAQNQVRVVGPQSIIEKIHSAAVDVVISGFTENISTLSDVFLYDKEGNVVEHKNLKMNVESIRVDVEILATKSVPLKFSTMGTPAEGYDQTGEIESDYESVILAGTKEVMNTINELEIPASALNITGQSSDMMVLLNLKDYLPSGIRSGDSTFAGKVAVTVYIEPLVNEDFSIYYRNISKLNVPEGYTAHFVESGSDTIEFTAVGLEQNIEKIQLSQLATNVDFDEYMKEHEMTEVTEGTYRMRVNFAWPEGVTIKEDAYVHVKVEKE